MRLGLTIRCFAWCSLFLAAENSTNSDLNCLH